MTIDDIENKIKNKIKKYENELDEEFKELLLNYIKIFHLVHENLLSHIEELKEKDNSNKEIAVKLVDLKEKYKIPEQIILKEYKFFLEHTPKKSLNIAEIEFKLFNE